MSPTRDNILQSLHGFCDSFASKKSIDEILSHFSNDLNVPPSIIEHGHPGLAPFLGRRFVGLENVRSYLVLISELLTYSDMRFSDFMVDVEARKASVKGEARFQSTESGNAWDEAFVWTLDMDDDGVKIVHWQVWADSGCAYLARLGRLCELDQRL